MAIQIFNLILGICSFILLLYFVSSERVWFKKYVWKLFRKINISQSEYTEFISSLSEVLMKFSKKKIGALIVIEKFQNLQKYINSGYELRSKFFPEFLYNIFFNKESSIHDGGVIIRALEIRSVSSFFPLISGDNIPNQYGSRHRAALGITLKTDAIALLVSETSGKIMSVEDGKISELEKNNISLLTSKLLQLFSFYLD